MKRAILSSARRHPWLPVGLGGVAIWLILGMLAQPDDAAGLVGASWAGKTDTKPAAVLLTYGIGGVLTADGTLWQYRPDIDRWLTIDEAFRKEGQKTHVMPLPVPADQIRDMATFGFILTKSGDLWFYELSSDKWRRLNSPTESR